MSPTPDELADWEKRLERMIRLAKAMNYQYACKTDADLAQVNERFPEFAEARRKDAEEKKA